MLITIWLVGTTTARRKGHKSGCADGGRFSGSEGRGGASRLELSMALRTHDRGGDSSSLLLVQREESLYSRLLLVEHFYWTYIWHIMPPRIGLKFTTESLGANVLECARLKYMCFTCIPFVVPLTTEYDVI